MVNANKLKAFFSNTTTLFWIGVIATLVITTLEFVHDGAENYINFRDATRNFFLGISSYTPEYVANHGRYFIYSPVFHYLFAPFAYLPFYVGGYLWNLVGWIVFFFAIKTLPGELKNHTAALIGWLLLFVMQSVFCFQYNILVCCIFLLAFSLLENDKPFWAILLIMLSATTKVYGAVELALLLCYPKFWRNIGYAALCGLLLLLLPATKLGLHGLIPWYMDWVNMLTSHTENTCVYYSLIWAQPLQAWSIHHIRLFQVILLGILSVLFFLCHKAWGDYRFKVGVLATLMIYIVLLSEAAEFTTHMISATGFALWYFLKKEHIVFEKILFWALFILFGIMPIDIFFPSTWCMYTHTKLWIGVWVFTLAWCYLISDTLISLIKSK